MNEIPKMRTIPQAAQDLNIPVYALRRWVKDGSVPCVYAGRKAFVNLDTLISFLNRGSNNDNLI